jgi:hypothetical protein
MEAGAQTQVSSSHLPYTSLQRYLLQCVLFQNILTPKS